MDIMTKDIFIADWLQFYNASKRSASYSNVTHLQLLIQIEKS